MSIFNGKCRFCGSEVLWAAREDGKKIPYSPIVSAFEVLPFGEEFRAWQKESKLFVPHPSVCRNYKKKPRRYENSPQVRV